ncbi:MAG: HYR domain-containing protein, partial [Verrucomicrobiales bacterium]|nr:HYR domain-containing protein [Verrucomicrobiales bacterium]
IRGLVLEEGTLRAIIAGTGPLPGEGAIAAFAPVVAEPPLAPEETGPVGPYLYLSTPVIGAPTVVGESVTMRGVGFCPDQGCSAVDVKVVETTVIRGLPVGATGNFQATFALPSLPELERSNARVGVAEIHAFQSSANNQTIEARTMLLVTTRRDSEEEEEQSEPLELKSAGTWDGFNLGACFNQMLNRESAENVSNYVVNGGAVPVMSAELREDGKSVRLRLGAPLAAGSFSLLARNVVNLSGQTGGGSVDGVVPNFLFMVVDLGTPLPPGDAFSCESGSIEISAGGKDARTTADQFHFVSRPLTGDFDVSVQVLPVTGSDMTVGGLVARESVRDPAAKSIGLFLAPNFNVPPEFQEVSVSVRSVTGGDAQTFGTANPAEISSAPFLRLRRLGHVFTAFSSQDGVSWKIFGRTDTSALPFTETLAVGFGAASATQNQTATVEFRDFQFTQPAAACLDLACPIVLTVPCQTSDGAFVTFAISARNRCDPSDLKVVCDHPSGSFFPVGTTTVHCSATGSDETSQCNFTVTVLGDCSGPLYAGMSSALQGAAQAQARADGSLRLSNIGNSGLDGVRFDFGAAEGVRMMFDGFARADQLPAEAVFTATALGEAGETLASLRLQRHSGYALLEAVPDFTALASATYSVRLYNGTRLVYESLGRTAPPPNQPPLSNQLFLTAQPSAVRVLVRPGVGLVFEYLFTGGDGMQVYQNGNSLNFNPVNRMEIFAGVARPGPQSLTGLDLRFSGITARIITGATLTKYGQEIGASRGVLLSGAHDELAVRTQPVPAHPLPGPPDPAPPILWNVTNPLGYFGDRNPGNPSAYNGYWEERNPLGHEGDWDLRIDLTDRPSQALNVDAFRPGKSGAELKAIVPMFAPGAKLRFVAGGVMDALPGALTVEMGSLLFERIGDRVELVAIPGTHSVQRPGPQTGYQLRVTLSDGSVRRFDGAADELRVGWDATAAAADYFLPVVIGPDGRLAMGMRLAQPGPIMMRLPDGTSADADWLEWLPAQPTLPEDPFQRWNPGSLRGLLLVGENVPAVSIESLTTSAVNPRPTAFFGGRPVRALGNATFSHDAFGTLLLSGLSQSGEDGIAITFPEPVSGEIATVNPGYLPLNLQVYPRAGAILDLRVVAEGASTPNAVLAGKTLTAGGPHFLGVRFPDLQATRNTLRLFRGDQLRFEQTARPSEAEDVRGNLAPDAIPDRVTAQIVGGQFMWRLAWNGDINISVFNQPGGNPILADRVEIVTEDAMPYPRGANTLELRASNFDTLRLLNLGDRAAPPVPELNFNVAAGRLRLDWGPAAAGVPKLQSAPAVDGPWRNVGLGNLVNGERMAEVAVAGPQGFTRLVTPEASEGCLEFSGEALGDRSNPWEFAEWKFDRFRPDASHDSRNEIVESGGIRALRIDGRLDIELPAPA